MTNTEEFVLDSLCFAEKCKEAIKGEPGLEYFLRSIIEAADKYVGSLETPNAEDVPVVVKRSIVLAAHDMPTARARLALLNQYGVGSDKFWGFRIGSMFVGVEADGYMHT